MAHVNMVAAVQPFLSGSVSKTVNLPKTATVEDIENLFIYKLDRGEFFARVVGNQCINDISTWEKINFN
jgi:ribonucleoside-diphosphate reductase alpha chain